MFCMNCGKKLDEGETVCTRCGTPADLPDAEPRNLPSAGQEADSAAAPAMPDGPDTTASPIPAVREAPISDSSAAPPRTGVREPRKWIAACGAAIALCAILIVFLPRLGQAAPKDGAAVQDADTVQQGADEAQPAPAAEPQTPAPVADAGEAVDLSAYLGRWTPADGTAEIHTGGTEFIVACDADGRYTVEATAVYQGGNKIVWIAPVPLFLTSSTAVAQYTDDGWGNAGKIVLRMERGALYAAVTKTGSGAWSMEMEETRCVRAPEEPTGEAALAEVQEQAYVDYLYGLNCAINCGDFSEAASTMQTGSALYTQQKKLVAHLSGRGIREEVISYLLLDWYPDANGTWKLVAAEEIMVYEADGSSRLVAQTYAYTLEQDADGIWRLTDLDDAADAYRTAAAQAYTLDTRLLDDAALAGYTQEEVKRLRNEIYARHGYIFQDEALRSWFAAQDWYVPDPQYSDARLNDMEKKNLDVIVAYEQKMGWRT